MQHKICNIIPHTSIILLVTNYIKSDGEDEEDGEEVHPLTWKCRLQIALDVINGLNYLHDGPELEKIIIHCDLKPANILLDEVLLITYTIL